MKTMSEIQAAQQRTMSVFERRPESAMDTVSGEAVVTEGLTCTFVQGDRSSVMDMPAPVGGSENGPTPGYHARAAVAGCVAIGIKMTAARLGVDFTTVRVGVEMDFDNSAVLGMGDSSAAPLSTRLDIAVESEASDTEVQKVVDAALKADPYFLALRDPQHVEARVRKV